MDKNIWFISDHHFHHSNFLKFVDKHGCLIRPEFDNVDQMNEFMVEAHNKAVKPDDTVWFGGDVVWGDDYTILSKLNGKLNITPGNHDKGEELAKTGLFHEIRLWKQFHIEILMKKYKFILSHVPLGKADLEQRTNFNVHGHTHEIDVLDQHGAPDERYVNICVEQLGYEPIHIDMLQYLFPLDGIKSK